MNLTRKDFDTVHDFWISELESGKYKHTAGTLKFDRYNNTSYCCLGIYCEMLKVNPGNVASVEIFHRLTGQQESIHEKYLKYAELLEDTNYNDVLARINDNSNSFNRVIEFLKNEKEHMYNHFIEEYALSEAEINELYLTS
jgi:hypothetical protein